MKVIAKLLNKDGILLLSTPSLNAPLHKIGYARDFDNSVGHLRRYDIETLGKLCKNNGLKVLESRKIEGVVRNFLFLSPRAGKSVRFIKFFISDLVTFIDNLTIPVIGESNIILVAKEKMKILFLTRRFYPDIGGVEKHIDKISSELIKRGHEIIVITENPKNYKNHEKINGIEIYRIPIESENGKKWTIWKWLVKNRNLIKEADISSCS